MAVVVRCWCRFFVDAVVVVGVVFVSLLMCSCDVYCWFCVFWLVFGVRCVVSSLLAAVARCCVLLFARCPCLWLLFVVVVVCCVLVGVVVRCCCMSLKNVRWCCSLFVVFGCTRYLLLLAACRSIA